MIRSFFVFCLFCLLIPIPDTLAQTSCVDTDPVGDGWGWDGSESCVVGDNTDNTADNTSSSACVDTDPVGDGWGWDGSESCVVGGSTDNTADNTSSSACVDTDPVGDGWGWDGSESCVVGGSNDNTADNTSSSVCVDTDPVGDGWGWDGFESCVVGGSTNSAAGNTSPDILQRANTILAAWTGWVGRHNPTESSISIAYLNDEVLGSGLGRQATTSAPIASLTKAITGICIAKLVQEGSISFDSRLGSVVPEVNSDVTIGSLLTHTSGHRTDVTQSPANFPRVDQELLLWVSQQELATPVGSSSYFYNNANYAMLGAAIAEVTGKTYEQACAERVLEPAGIRNARLNPDWRIMSSWGGWQLAVTDYQSFLSMYFSNTGVLGQSPFDFPHVELGGGAHYGMGYLFRQGQNGGFNFWHDGQWHADYNQIQHRFGAFFARWDSGWAVTTNHNISAINGEHFELDTLLFEAAH